METVKIIVDIFSCFLEMVIATFFFSAFKERRVSKKVLYLVVFATTVLFVIVRAAPINSGLIFVSSLVLTLALSLCYNFKVHNALLTTLLISVLSALAEQVTMMLLTMSGIEFEKSQNNIYIYITAIIMSKFITGIVVVVVNRGRHRLFQSVKNNNFIGVLMLPFTTILFIVLFWKFFEQYTVSKSWQITSLATVILMITANVMVFYIVDKQYELITAKQRLKTSEVLFENQRVYYDNMFESQKELRKMKHDLKNIFIAVLSLMDAGRYEDAKQAVEKQLEETERGIFHSSDQTDNIINSVIYSKSKIAEKHNIKLRFDLKVWEKIKIDFLDVAVMLGNLLDNAIEATSKIDQENREIELELFVDKGNFLILVKNPIDKVVNVKHLETTKSDKKNHGFGLMSVRTIVEKYKGECLLLCEDGIFSVRILAINDEYAR